MGLLLLHGALGSAEQLSGLRERVGGVSIDLSGHGPRPIPEHGVRFEDLLSDIDAAFEANGWASAHLFGYSMGGYAALLYAAKHPERVRSVITLGTKLVWTEEGLQKELRMLDPDVMLAKVPGFAEALARVHGEERWRSVVIAIAQSMSGLAAKPLLTAEVAAEVECPVLVCVGSGDTTAVPADTEVFAKGLRHSQVLVLPGVRHPLESVDLDAFVPLMERFWWQADQRPTKR